MTMTSTIRGGIAVLAGLLSLYILENTFGTSMDTLYQSFNSIISKLYMTPQWKATATTSLGNWVWFDRAFVICVIALFVWWATTIFIDTDYSKQRGY